MTCDDCCNWKSEELTYSELLDAWGTSISTPITPGYQRRYRKEAGLKRESIDIVKIRYKYCSAGQLRRFYLAKHESDTKAAVPMSDCLHFNSEPSLTGINDLRHILATEAHGLSEYRGIEFTTGLYENNTYMRIPLYGSVKPVVKRSDTTCSMCGQRSNRSITVKLEKAFCCNQHYIEWWAKRYREELEELKSVEVPLWKNYH